MASILPLVPTKNAPPITLCQRPGFGDEGSGSRKRTEVLTNRFELRMGKASNYYQYIVEFYRLSRNEDESGHREPLTGDSNSKKELRRCIFNAFQTSHRSDIFQHIGAAYDGGSVVYTTRKLALGETNRTSELVELNNDHNHTGRPNEYYIHIKDHDNEPEILLDDLRAVLTSNNFEWDFFNNQGLKMINAFLHHNPALKYTQYGESIFDPGTKELLGGGVELWQGFFSSARSGDGKVYLNVNVNHMTAYEPVSLEEWICKFIGKQRLPGNFNKRTFDNINSVIKDIKVRPLHRPECKTKYIVCRLHNKNAHQATFPNKDGKTISVAEHFKNVYNVTLKTHHIIEIRKGKTLIPIEFCGIIEGQRYQDKHLTGEQRAKIIRITAKRPNTNKKLILDGIKNVLLLKQEGLFQQAGFTVDMEMALVPAHFKEMPELTFASPSNRPITVKPEECDATWNLRDLKFFKRGENLLSLFAISFLPGTFSKSVKGFLRKLGDQARKLGMEISTEAPQVECVQWVDYNQAREEISKILEDKRSKNCLPQLVFYILEDKKNCSQVYNPVKVISDTQIGILSQCIQASRIKDVKTAYLSNVALKLNLKLNGINYTMDLPRTKKVPTMFLGADVTHPPSGSKGVPSIAAVVGSVDEYAVQYVEKHREQHKESKNSQKTGRGKEEIDDMSDMVYEILCEFEGVRKSFPQSLIMCRDGISESQFQSLALEKELPSIKAACHKVDPNYNPTITYIVACKRHQTRFYPKQPDDENDRNKNVKPGLTVERDITHPQFFDFYINSHSSLQGTSRSCRYCVLYDENGFGADEIQDLLNKLCYNFQRSPRAVSIPAPTYYAHCAAKRARSHIVDGQLHVTEPNLASRYPMYYV
ncbi:4314_t:CDS:2 [Paraglomus brasilianum]|uniref:4314_t:CDS:1 n=1 Tax=Paraglomus brasilianum TaxID=144538 RepID=A0A9N9BN09_9GLOM|nr:4314_t:CDS:2 [Paraglomus brasilianum]